MKHVGKPSKSAMKRVAVKSDIPNAPMDFEGFIQHGEPDKFTAQTVNGTAKWCGTGWNRDGRGGWAAGSFSQHSPQVELWPTWLPGRSNRTGE